MSYGLFKNVIHKLCLYKSNLIHLYMYKEAVTKITDTLPQEDFHGGFQNLLEQ